MSSATTQPDFRLAHPEDYEYWIPASFDLQGDIRAALRALGPGRAERLRGDAFPEDFGNPYGHHSLRACAQGHYRDPLRVMLEVDCLEMREVRRVFPDLSIAAWRGLRSIQEMAQRGELADADQIDALLDLAR